MLFVGSARTFVRLRTAEGPASGNRDWDTLSSIVHRVRFA